MIRGQCLICPGIEEVVVQYVAPKFQLLSRRLAGIFFTLIPIDIPLRIILRKSAKIFSH